MTFTEALSFSRAVRVHFLSTFKAIFTDKAVALVMVGAVILYSFFYPMGYTEQVAAKQILVVVDADSSPFSRQLIRMLDASRSAALCCVVHNIAEAEALLRENKAMAILVMDENFTRSIATGEGAHLQLMGNGAYLSRASNLMMGIGDVIKAFAQDVAVERAQSGVVTTSPPIHLIQRPVFNTREGYGSALVVGVAQLIVHQTLLIGIGVLLATRRERHGPRHYKPEEFLAMAAAFWCIGMLGVCYYAGFTFWIHDYPLGGNLTGLFVFGAVFVGAVVMLGMLLGSFFRVREQPYQWLLILSLPIFFLSNLTWPQVASPAPLVAVAQWIPAVPAINGLVKLNQMGAELSLARRELWGLIGLMFVYGTAAYWRFCVAKPVVT